MFGTGKGKKRESFLLTNEKTMKLSNWFSIACLAWGCCLGSSRGQDVAESSMVNVDLEMQQFRKDRAAILRYCVLLELCCEIVSLEGQVHGRKNNGIGTGLMPERFEKECPPDFRHSYIDVLNMMDECLRNGKPEGPEMQSRLDDARKRFHHQYDLDRSMLDLIEWLDRQTMKRQNESNEELLKRLEQWKKELESGRAVIPYDAGKPPEGGILNSRIGKMLFEWRIIKEVDALWGREGIQGEGIPVPVKKVGS